MEEFLLLAQDLPPTPDFLDWVIKVASVHGVAWLFLVGVLGCILRVTHIVIQLMKEWVPKKIQASINRDANIVKNMELQTRLLYCIHDQAHTTKIGMRLIAGGFQKFVDKHGERLGIGSDVADSFKIARDVLSERRSKPYGRHHDGPGPDAGGGEDYIHPEE